MAALKAVRIGAAEVGRERAWGMVLLLTGCCCCSVGRWKCGGRLLRTSALSVGIDAVLWMESFMEYCRCVRAPEREPESARSAPWDRPTLTNLSVIPRLGMRGDEMFTAAICCG